jgi:hypothetical protein
MNGIGLSLMKERSSEPIWYIFVELLFVLPYSGYYIM